MTKAMTLLSGLVALACVSTVVRAADPPFVGKWKVNLSKSSLTGDTVTIGSSANGMMEFSSQGFSYSFKLDGHDYPMPDGGTTAWTATSATVWDVTNHLKGKVTNTYHLALTGDVLAVSGKTMKADGTPMAFSSSYKRMSGGPGFAGKWMSTQVQLPATTLQIAADGANGVLMSDETGQLCRGQFDSKDNPTLGMSAGSKSTCAFRKIDDRSFEMTSKLAGKAMYVDVYTVSADGRTLTDTGTPTNAAKETYKIVLDRQ
jgi:hypothetical protein